jgi:hypothetical protein
MQVLELAPEVLFVVPTCHPIEARRGVLLQFEKRLFQSIHGDMMQERGELLLLPFLCCFPYAVQAVGRAFPANGVAIRNE